MVVWTCCLRSHIDLWSLGWRSRQEDPSVWLETLVTAAKRQETEGTERPHLCLTWKRRVHTAATCFCYNSPTFHRNHAKEKQTPCYNNPTSPMSCISTLNERSWNDQRFQLWNHTVASSIPVWVVLATQSMRAGCVFKTMLFTCVHLWHKQDVTFSPS